MIKKFFLFLLSLFLIQNVCYAKDKLQFDFPNEGWHQVASPDGIESKKCYVPYNQTAENYSEMLVFNERKIKTEGLSPVIIMQKQLGKDKNNYPDIVPEYVSQNIDNAMALWCSQTKNICSVQRVFQGTEGIITAVYINKAPHYSQNIFGQWTNILSNIKVYIPKEDESISNNIIELD